MLADVTDSQLHKNNPPRFDVGLQGQDKRMSLQKGLQFTVES